MFLIALQSSFVLYLCFENGTVGILLYTHVILKRYRAAFINVNLNARNYIIKDRIDKLTSHRNARILVTYLILDLESFFLQGYL